MSKENLVKEGKDPSTIYVTGNTAIDALNTTVRVDYSHEKLDWVGESRHIMITVHRRENLGEPMKNMFRAEHLEVLDFHNFLSRSYFILTESGGRQEEAPSIGRSVFEANDLVFLYSNEVGVIARGIATGNVEKKDYQGKPNEEHYMHLHNFEVLKTPLTAAEFTQITREVAGEDYKVMWNQPLFLLSHKYGSAVWEYITKYCV